MSKPLLGLVIGAVLGLIDGASAKLYDDPRVQAEIIEIVFGSMFKGLVTGLVAGFVARKTSSLALGIATGLATGLVLSALVVWMGKVTGSSAGDHPYAIILPGMAVGVICGFATQRYGRPPRTVPA